VRESIHSFLLKTEVIQSGTDPGMAGIEGGAVPSSSPNYSVSSLGELSDTPDVSHSSLSSSSSGVTIGEGNSVVHGGCVDGYYCSHRCSVHVPVPKRFSAPSITVSPPSHSESSLISRSILLDSARTLGPAPSKFPESMIWWEKVFKMVSIHANAYESIGNCQPFRDDINSYDSMVSKPPAKLDCPSWRCSLGPSHPMFIRAGKHVDTCPLALPHRKYILEKRGTGLSSSANCGPDCVSVREHRRTSVLHWSRCRLMLLCFWFMLASCQAVTLSTYNYASLPASAYLHTVQFNINIAQPDPVALFVQGKVLVTQTNDPSQTFPEILGLTPLQKTLVTLYPYQMTGVVVRNPIFPAELVPGYYFNCVTTGLYFQLLAPTGVSNFYPAIPLALPAYLGGLMDLVLDPCVVSAALCGQAPMTPTTMCQQGLIPCTQVTYGPNPCVNCSTMYIADLAIVGNSLYDSYSPPIVSVVVANIVITNIQVIVNNKTHSIGDCQVYTDTEFNCGTDSIYSPGGGGFIIREAIIQYRKSCRCFISCVGWGSCGGGDVTAAEFNSLKSDVVESQVAIQDLGSRLSTVQLQTDTMIAQVNTRVSDLTAQVNSGFKRLSSQISSVEQYARETYFDMYQANDITSSRLAQFQLLSSVRSAQHSVAVGFIGLAINSLRYDVLKSAFLSSSDYSCHELFQDEIALFSTIVSNRSSFGKIFCKYVLTQSGISLQISQYVSTGELHRCMIPSVFANTGQSSTSLLPNRKCSSTGYDLNRDYVCCNGTSFHTSMRMGFESGSLPYFYMTKTNSPCGAHNGVLFNLGVYNPIFDEPCHHLPNVTGYRGSIEVFGVNISATPFVLHPELYWASALQPNSSSSINFPAGFSQNFSTPSVNTSSIGDLISREVANSVSDLQAWNISFMKRMDELIAATSALHADSSSNSCSTWDMWCWFKELVGILLGLLCIVAALYGFYTLVMCMYHRKHDPPDEEEGSRDE